MGKLIRSIIKAWTMWFDYMWGRPIRIETAEDVKRRFDEVCKEAHRKAVTAVSGRDKC